MERKNREKNFFFFQFSLMYSILQLYRSGFEQTTSRPRQCVLQYYCTVYCALYSSLQTFKHELFEPSPLTTADSLYNFAPSLPHTSTSQHSLIVPCMQSCEAFRIRSSKNRIRIFRRRIRMSMLKFKTCLSNLTVNVFLLLLLFTFDCQIQFTSKKTYSDLSTQT